MNHKLKLALAFTLPILAFALLALRFGEIRSNLTGAANQVLGINAGNTAGEFKTLTSTANQVTVTHGVGTVTFSTPQNINTDATPSFNSLFTDAQISLRASPYGVAAGNTGELRLLELAAGGTNYTGFKAPDAIGADLTLTLPDADGSSQQVLFTNGAGALGWRSVTDGLALFGDASDGDVAVGPGTTTLTRDMYYHNLTVAAGRTIDTAGFAIFATGTVSLDGTIANNGRDGANGSAGGAGGVAGGTGSGGAGGAGTNADSGGVPSIITSVGAAGGAGGDSGDGGDGGAGGSVTAPLAAEGGVRSYLNVTSARVNDGFYTPGNGGCGGGSAAAGGVGGGGGGGGGIIRLICYNITIGATGFISASGGDGGDGQSSAVALDNGGGGGGGGGGGAIFLVYDLLVNGGTIAASKGTGGAFGTGGAGGAPGVAGSDGVDGSVIQMPMR